MPIRGEVIRDSGRGSFILLVELRSRRPSVLTRFLDPHVYPRLPSYGGKMDIVFEDAVGIFIAVARGAQSWRK